MKNPPSEMKSILKLQYLQIQLYCRQTKNKCVLLKVIKLLFLTYDSEHVREIESTSHESELQDDENELLFSDSEEEFEIDVADSSSGLPIEEVYF